MRGAGGHWWVQKRAHRVGGSWSREESSRMPTATLRGWRQMKVLVGFALTTHFPTPFTPPWSPYVPLPWPVSGMSRTFVAPLVSAMQISWKKPCSSGLMGLSRTGDPVPFARGLAGSCSEKQPPGKGPMVNPRFTAQASDRTEHTILERSSGV